MSATRLPHRVRERGSMMVASSILLVTMAGFALLLVSSSQATHKEVSARLDATKAFYVAEGGLDFAIAQIAVEQFWPITSTTRFPTINNDVELESNWIPLGSDGGEFKLFITYEDEDGTDLSVADRSAEPLYNQVELRVLGRSGQAQRSVRARVQFQVTNYDSAIVSDSPEIGTASGGGKGLAKDHGTVSFDSGNQYVYGGIRANAGVYVDDVDDLVTNANKASLFDAFTGDIYTELYGTDEEIPDFTDPGSPEQLFEFERFKAAAQTYNRGQYYDGLDAFEDGVRAANLAGESLHGITYVHIDAAVEGNDPKIEHGIPINIQGTLVFDFSNVGDDFYKVFIKVPLNINAATLPSPFNPANEAHMLTGYPPTIDSDKDARGYAMGDATYADFPANADMPALMFNTGTVDIHDAANVCGAVYGPSFIEIENKGAELQYFNGIIIGGGGVYLEGKTGTGSAQVFVYDNNTVNALPTFKNRAKTPVRSGYLIDE